MSAVPEVQKECKWCKNPEVKRYLFDAASQCATHPLVFVRVLAQLGYEPMPLLKGRRFGFAGKQCYSLPNQFSFLKHIYQDKGFGGLFTGLSANLCGSLISTAAASVITVYLEENLAKGEEEEEKVNQKTGKEAWMEMWTTGIRQSAAIAGGRFLAHPFHVVMVRMMGAYGGSSVDYSTLRGAFSAMKAEEGTPFFNGLVPELIAHVGLIWAANYLVFFLEEVYNRFAKKEVGKHLEGFEQYLKKLFEMGASFFAKQALYPYHVVGTVMAANGPSLDLGHLPRVLEYQTWQDCWKMMSSKHQLSRGASAMFRAYDGPILYREGRMYADTKYRAG